MQKIPVVEENKVTKYLLAPEHEKGGPKARFFLRFKFDRDHPDILIDALISHWYAHPIHRTVMTDRGPAVTKKCAISTLDGRDPCIRSVWMDETGTGVYRLITAYPATA